MVDIPAMVRYGVTIIFETLKGKGSSVRKLDVLVRLHAQVRRQQPLLRGTTGVGLRV